MVRKREFTAMDSWVTPYGKLNISITADFTPCALTDLSGEIIKRLFCLLKTEEQTDDNELENDVKFNLSKRLTSAAREQIFKDIP